MWLVAVLDSFNARNQRKNRQTHTDAHEMLYVPGSPRQLSPIRAIEEYDILFNNFTSVLTDRSVIYNGSVTGSVDGSHGSHGSVRAGAETQESRAFHARVCVRLFFR